MHAECRIIFAKCGLLASFDGDRDSDRMTKVKRDVQ